MDGNNLKNLKVCSRLKLILERVGDKLRRIQKPANSSRSEQIEQKAENTDNFSGRIRLNRRTLTIGVLAAIVLIINVVAILVSCFPVYQVHSSSMSPMLNAGDTVVCMKGNNYGVGDVVAVEYQGMILIKRIVAGGGDVVILSEDGTLFVNDDAVDEPYATTDSSDKRYIMQVPQGKWYILSDNRVLSGDSRLNEIGSVSDEEIIGRVIITL